MPAKSICPNCGQKFRNASHICMPTSVQKMDKRKAAIAAVSSKQK